MLKDRCPSVIRNSALMFIFRLAGGILGTVCIIIGVAIFINVAGGYNLLNRIAGKELSLDSELYEASGYTVAMVLVVVGILCSIIASLAGKLINRNLYIIDVNRFIEEEVNGQPGTIINQKEVTITMKETEAIV